MEQLIFNILLVGPALFIITALVFGLLKPNYTPVRMTISEGALGKYGWVQTTNFFVSGGLIALLGLLLLTRNTAPYSDITVFVLGLILFLSGIYPTDPVQDTVKSTRTGLIHNLLFAVGMLAILSGQVVAAISNSSTTLGPLSWGAFVFTFASLFSFLAIRKYPGWPQRIMVAIIMTWVTLFALLT